MYERIDPVMAYKITSKDVNKKKNETAEISWPHWIKLLWGGHSDFPGVRLITTFDEISEAKILRCIVSREGWSEFLNMGVGDWVILEGGAIFSMCDEEFQENFRKIKGKMK